MGLLAVLRRSQPAAGRGALGFAPARRSAGGIPPGILEELLEEYATALLVSNRRPRTIAVYVSAIRRYVATEGPPWMWTRAGFERWCVARFDHWGTVEQCRSAMHEFCRLLHDPQRQWVGRFAAWGLALPGDIVPPMLPLHDDQSWGGGRRWVPQPAELREMFDAAERVTAELRRTHPSQLRLANVLALAKAQYGLGVRPGELVATYPEDFRGHFRHPEYGGFGCVEVVSGKGGRSRSVAVARHMSWVTPVLEDYAHNLRPVLLRGREARTFFVSSRGEPLSVHAYEAALAELRQRAGWPDGATPHLLRHCYATHLFQWGVPLSVLQKNLGHQYPSTTSIYLKTGEDWEAEQVDLAFERITGTSGGLAHA